MPVVVIKVGSNVATDESGALRESVLESIVAQAAELHRRGTDVVMVTSGAISRGIQLLGLVAPDRDGRVAGVVGGGAGSDLSPL